MMHTGKHVYFARRKDGIGPVKIGVSRIPEYRIYRMSRDLEVVATVPGVDFLERQFHTLLREWHVGHEWFEASDAVLAVVEQVKSGAFDLSSLPANPILITRKKAEYSSERRAAIGARTRAACARRKAA